MRRLSIAAAGLLAVALVAAGTPAMARAAEIRQVIVSNNGQANPGTIEISIDTDEPVAAIHADFINQETAQPGGAADDFVLGEPAGTWLRYRTASPVIMEPGDYEVEVRITGADGAVTRHTDQIRYLVVATVEDVRLDPPVVDWDHRDVTVTGVLRGRWPGTGEVRPIGGATIDYWVHLAGGDPIVTAADGTFSRTFTMSGVINVIELRYWSGSPHTVDGGLVDRSVEVAPQETRVSMSTDKRRAKAGEPITLTGTIERRGPAGWVPAPPRFDVWIDNGCDDTGCAFGFNDVQVAPDGTFSVQTPAQRTGYFKVAVSSSLQYFSGSTGRTRVVTVH